MIVNVSSLITCILFRALKLCLFVCLFICLGKKNIAERKKLKNIFIVCCIVVVLFILILLKILCAGPLEF